MTIEEIKTERNAKIALRAQLEKQQMKLSREIHNLGRLINEQAKAEADARRAERQKAHEERQKAWELMTGKPEIDAFFHEIKDIFKKYKEGAQNAN